MQLDLLTQPVAAFLPQTRRSDEVSFPDSSATRRQKRRQRDDEAEKQQACPLKPVRDVVIYIGSTRLEENVQHGRSASPCLLVCSSSSSSPLPSPPLPALPPQTDSCTNALHCKKLNHTVFLCFVLPPLTSVFKVDHYKHVQNVTKRNVHWFVFSIQGRQKRLLRQPALAPPRPSLLPASDSECSDMRPPPLPLSS